MSIRALAPRLRTLLLVLLVATRAASAVERDTPYLGAAVGAADHRESCDGADGLGLRCDAKSSAWRLYGGYQLTSSLGFELGYVDLGTTRAENGSPLPPFSATVGATGLTLAATGTLPLGSRFSLVGELGVLFWKADLRLRAEELDESVDDTGSGALLGLGAEVRLTRGVRTRITWERFQDVGGAGTTGRSDVDFVAAALLFTV
jgi:OOP family OmpA-OmpF porin